jgi:tetratricopeptide (TPR) repeat protein/DNA-binding winged helix-turn-helix (wHTH) protein
VNPALLKGFHLGDVLVEPGKQQVVAGNSPVHLPPRAMEVLLYLASNPGELVTHESILEHVWGHGHGSHEALSSTVSEIRHALGDHADKPKYVQTLPRRGYRLMQMPQPLDGGSAARPAATGDNPTIQGIGLLANLQRRGVIETGIAYLVLGWLIIQVGDIVFSQLHLPDWTGTFVTVLIIAGFPIALLLSWILEIRDGRVVRDDRTPDAIRTRRFSRTYLSIIGALTIAALLVFAYDRNVGLPRSTGSEVARDSSRYLPPVLENSIAVLRFMNLDGGNRTQVFSNGLAEDLITRLSQVPGLLVSSRGDSFTLEPNTASAHVRERLRVSYYLEGSVQIDDDAIRVIVDLIDSATGFHILSRKFDRPLARFFEMRDEIADLTVANVRVALPPSREPAPLAEYEAPDLDAYVAYRRGKEIYEQPRSLDSIAQAISHYTQALRIDPHYAAAHAGICDAHVARFELSNSADDIQAAQDACAKALATAPRLYIVHTSLGDLDRRTGRLARAEREYNDALALNANDVRAMTGLSSVFALRQDYARAEQLLQKAMTLQPGNWRTINSYGTFLFSVGRYQDAAGAYRQVVALDPENYQARTNLGAALTMAGDFAAGKEVFEESLAIREFRTAYSNLGVIYYYLGEFDKSVAMHRKAIELSPDETVKWVNLADALYFDGQRTAAADAFRRAAELGKARLDVDPTDVETLFLYAWALQMLGDADAARQAIGKGLAIAPTDPYGLYYAGLIDARAGRPESALKSLRLAVDNGYPPGMLAAEPYLSELRANPTFRSIISASR